MFGYIDSFFDDPIGMLTVFLLALPGRLLAISAHEAAHGLMAYRCGDDTAKRAGRVTLNPFKHLDLIGTIMMLFVGIGWAKPVPVNPLNYKNYRKDDLLVSLAGIAMNLLLFIIGCLAMYAVVGFALYKASLMAYPDDIFIEYYNGAKSVFVAGEGGYTYMPLGELLRYAPYISDFLIVPMFGQLAGWLMQVLSYFVIVNLTLAVFNLIPVPPLDGYHVLNDFILKRELFASGRASNIFTLVMFGLMFTGVLSKVLGFAQDWAFTGAGFVCEKIFGLLGLI